jgi:hypothetical protein
MVSYRFLFFTTLSAFINGASGSFLADNNLFFLPLGDVLVSLLGLTTGEVVVVALGLATFLGSASVPFSSSCESSSSSSESPPF